MLSSPSQESLPSTDEMSHRHEKSKRSLRRFFVLGRVAVLGRFATEGRVAVALVAPTLLLLTMAAASNAEESEGVEEWDRWVPSVALDVSALGHTGKGSIDGSQIVGPRENITAQQATFSSDFPDLRVVNPTRSRADVLSALYGGDFEIMTPRLFKHRYAPRLFLNVSVLATNTLDVRLARDGDPGTPAFPPGSEDDGDIVGEMAVLGTGSQISVQHKDPQVHSGLGLAFTQNWGGSTIRIKPSVIYSRIPLKVSATTRRVVRLNNDNNATLDDPAAYRFIFLDESADEVYHGAGAALELEFSPDIRFGPLEFTMYLKGAATHLFGDLETNLTGSNPDFPDEQVFYKYSQDRWVFRGGSGFRLRWLPDTRSSR